MEDFIRKKAICISSSALILLSVIFTVYLYFQSFIENKFLFPQSIPFGEYISRAIPLIILLFFFTVVTVCGIALVLSSKKFLKILSSIFFTVSFILLVLILILSYLIGTGIGIWYSKTDDINDFGIIDPELNSNVQIGDINIKDIMSHNLEDVLCYSYEYHSQVAWLSFDIYFELQLDEDEYYSLIDKYEKESSFTKSESNTIINNNGEEINVSGIFVVNEDETTVEKWQEAYIAYSNTTHKVYVKLIGECYT